MSKPCWLCGGSGFLVFGLCTNCGGTGEEEEDCDEEEEEE